MIIIEGIDHVSFPVSDLDAAIDFYKDILGFDVIEKQSGSSEAFLQLGDIMLRLNQTEAVEGENHNDHYICFYVDEEDFDDALDEIEENNIEVVYGPENIRNGKKVIIRDIDGNKIGFSYAGK